MQAWINDKLYPSPASFKTLILVRTVGIITICGGAEGPEAGIPLPKTDFIFHSVILWHGFVL